MRKHTTTVVCFDGGRRLGRCGWELGEDQAKDRHRFRIFLKKKETDGPYVFKQE
jgi:hypothetical protein